MRLWLMGRGYLETCFSCSTAAKTWFSWASTPPVCALDLFSASIAKSWRTSECAPLAG